MVYHRRVKFHEWIWNMFIHLCIDRSSRAAMNEKCIIEQSISTLIRNYFWNKNCVWMYFFLFIQCFSLTLSLSLFPHIIWSWSEWRNEAAYVGDRAIRNLKNIQIVLLLLSCFKEAYTIYKNNKYSNYGDLVLAVNWIFICEWERMSIL